MLYINLIFMQQEGEIEFLCPLHKEKVICAKMTDTGSRMQCLKCLIGQNISIQELSQLLNELRSKKKIKLTEQQIESEKRLTLLKKLFLMIKESFNKGMNQIIQLIEDTRNQMIAKIKSYLEQLAQPIQSMTTTQVELHIQELKKESSTNNQIYLEQDQKVRVQTIKQYIELFKLLNKQLTIESIWERKQEKVEVQKIQDNNIINQQQIVEQIQCKLGQYRKIFEKDCIYSCYSMAMDKDERILVNGQYEAIQIWKFNADGSLTLKQTLEGHTGWIYCLCYSKKSHWLISGGYDKTVRIWKKEDNGLWNEFQVLEDHQEMIIDIILNNDEDQFISCSEDMTIKVWMNQINSDEWKCKQTLTEHTKGVKFLSFNPDCNLLASCGVDHIRIWSKGNDNLWIQQQVLDDPKNDEYIRICFIDSNEMIATTAKHGRLYRLTQNQQGKFKVKSQLLLNEIEEENSSYFPLVYNKYLKTAICRHSRNFTYILRKQADGEFAIHQMLEGNYYASYLSSNGQYLILGNYGNEKIQVQKLK